MQPGADGRRRASRSTYQWYAGDVTSNGTNTGVGTPIEFGATNLMSSDPIKHASKGAIGALIIEPAGATWTEDAASRAPATVYANGTSFREFVLLFQNDINLRYNGFGANTDPYSAAALGGATTIAVPNLAGEDDSEDSGQKAVNYRTEPLWKRMGFAPDTPLDGHGDPGEPIDPRTPTRDYDFTNVLSNSQIGGLDPVTPVFTATAGQDVRIRLLLPAGHARNDVFMVHGHIWEEEPYINNSTALGTNPLSEWKSAQYGVGPRQPLRLPPEARGGRRVRRPRRLPLPHVPVLPVRRRHLGHFPGRAGLPDRAAAAQPLRLPVRDGLHYQNDMPGGAGCLLTKPTDMSGRKVAGRRESPRHFFFPPFTWRREGACTSGERHSTVECSEACLRAGYRNLVVMVKSLNVKKLSLTGVLFCV